MDSDALKAKLENDVKAIDAWLETPLTKEVFTQLSDEETRAIRLICELPKDIESFFAHWGAVGALRALRLPGIKVQQKREELNEQINAL
jgi:hypothetical protein